MQTDLFFKRPFPDLIQSVERKKRRLINFIEISSVVAYLQINPF